MKNYGRLLWMVTLLVCTLIGIAAAVRPSGPGQTTKSASLSVAAASDQLPDAGVFANGAMQFPAAHMTGVTKSDTTDTTAFCDRGIVVSHDAGSSSNVAVIAASDPADAAAAVTFFAVPNGTEIRGQFKRVMSTNTTASSVVCLGH